MCSILGSLVLQAGLYCDAGALAFCLTLAGAQYSLLKSVQPDAASPVHGFNKAAAYSRPVYLCLCTTIVLVTNKWLEERVSFNTFNLYFIQVYIYKIFKYYPIIFLIINLNIKCQMILFVMICHERVICTIKYNFILIILSLKSDSVNT